MVNIKFSSFIATSLDGFIAREDGSLDWLPGADPSPSKNDKSDDDKTKDTTIEEDYGFESFLSTVDALLMGRKTYEFIKNSNAPWPYKDRKVYVLSTTYTKEKDIPERHKDKVILVQGEPHEVCKQMEADNVKHVYIDGGNTFQQYLSKDLIHRIIITTVPVLIGSGIPLFGNNNTEDNSSNSDIQLQLINCTSYKNGFVQRCYETSN